MSSILIGRSIFSSIYSLCFIPVGTGGNNKQIWAGLAKSTKLETSCAVVLDGDSCASHNERAFRLIRRTDILWF